MNATTERSKVTEQSVQDRPREAMEEGGVSPGEHGREPEMDMRRAAFLKRKRRFDADRAGEGGLAPGVHGRMVTDEQVHRTPSMYDNG